MALVYANRDQLVDYAPERYKARIPGEPEASRLLTSASGEVLLATRTAIYKADTAGYPTETPIRTAFQRATCAQALWWVINTGEETGSSDDYDSVSIGGVTLSKKSGSGSRAAGLPVGGSGRLAAQAATELAIAGLTPGYVTTIPPWFGP